MENKFETEVADGRVGWTGGRGVGMGGASKA